MSEASPVATPKGQRAILVVELEQDSTRRDLRGLGEIGQVVVGVKPDGSMLVKDPSPLTGKASRAKEKILMGQLEAKALRGSMDASRAWFQHLRWQEEMKRGKAPQRTDLHVSGVVTVVDDLTGQLPSAHQQTPVAVARVGESKKKAPARPRPVGASAPEPPKELPSGVSCPTNAIVVDVTAEGSEEGDG